MKVNAVVATKPWSVELQELSIANPGPEEVVVQVTHSWISPGTEGSFIRGERLAGDTPLAPNDPSPFPLVTGYQKVGVVTWVGENVKNFAVGERVFASVSRTDGLFFPMGGHVSPAITPAHQLWKIPEGTLPIEAFSGLVLTQVGYNCGSRPALTPGEGAIVIGDGLVGQWAAQTLAERGADVTLLGRHPERLEKFTRGTTTTECESLAKGQSVLVDTVGDLETVYALLPKLRREAHFVSAGFYGHEGKIDLQRLRNQELTVHTPSGWTTPRMDATLEWVAQEKLTTLPLITHRFPVADAAAAFDLFLHRRAPSLGILLEWPQ
jgi:bacteriochlorophyllide a dehydrogenase